MVAPANPTYLCAGTNTRSILETFRIRADRMDASRLDSSGSISIVLDRPVAETCG
jgi:hypothetical protein